MYAGHVYWPYVLITVCRSCEFEMHVVWCISVYVYHVLCVKHGDGHVC